MKKKIKGNIGAKTFLTMFTLLLLCCIFIYGMVMVFLPRNYHTELQNQFTADFYALVENLEENGWEETEQDMLAFSVKNNAALRIEDEVGSELFAVNVQDEEKTDGEVRTLSSSGDFTYRGTDYHLVATASLVAVTQSYNILIKLIPFILAVVLLISAVAAYACSRYFSKPLIDICGVAKRMARLDMTWKCDASRSDEIGQLSESLNEMSAQLKQALDSLQAANEQLQQDIEKEREQEKQRIDFFTSVSHELKTPIAIIKGELEGMIYQVGEYKDRDAYLCHCLKTVNDMENIVKEILSAARMGGSDFQLVRSDLNISQMLQKSCQRIKGKIEDNQMELYLDIQLDFHYEGDERLLEKVFSNVLNNAAAYSPAGASIYVTLRNGVLCVENTGIHIAEDDLKRIFTPFYRVDKSRNRNTGGSGLGLYITKTILDHHSIAYRMENTEDGVRFTAEFSKGLV